MRSPGPSPFRRRRAAGRSIPAPLLEQRLDPVDDRRGVAFHGRHPGVDEAAFGTDRHLTDGDMMDGPTRSTMDELAKATLAADKVLLF